MSDTAVVQLPWLAVFDQDMPSRVLSAYSHGTGFAILSEPPGAAGRVDAGSEAFLAVASRLHDADFVFTTLTAPLPRLSMLQDAISDAMTAKIESGHPLVVIIRQAEALSYATVRRLIALAELDQDGTAVLRFLLIGTDAMWPVLHEAGLGHLEDDPAAHIRLSQAATTSVPPALAITTMNPPRTLPRPAAYSVGAAAHDPRRLGDRLRKAFAGRGATLTRLAPVGVGVAFIAVAGWFILAPGRAVPERQAPAAVPAVTAQSPDARFAVLITREKAEIASHRLTSPPGDNLLDTRRQIDELLPLVSSQLLHSLTDASVGVETEPTRQMANPGPMPSAPAPDDFIHVTLQYSRGDKAAEARATRLLALLRSRGIPADEPRPAGTVIEQSSLAYYFDQDRTRAFDLVKQLPTDILSKSTQPSQSMPSAGSSDGASMPRPGEISISIGSNNDLGNIQPPSGKQT